MARIETHGLRRSVGVGGLFATAYGNVGSSIYYALGLVAAYALGLTPVVFMLAGGLFALTAKTYAEGAVDVPRGRRLLELRPPRVQRARVVHRRVGAEPRLHPHDRDLGVLRASLPGRVLAGADAPARDVIGGLIVIALLAWLNIRGIGESANLNLILAVLDLATQVLIICIGAVLVLTRRCSSTRSISARCRRTRT